MLQDFQRLAPCECSRKLRTLYLNNTVIPYDTLSMPDASQTSDYVLAEMAAIHFCSSCLKYALALIVAAETNHVSLPIKM